MPLSLSSKARIIPQDDTMLCLMYQQTHKIRGSNLVKPEMSLEEVHFATIVAVGPGRQVQLSGSEGNFHAIRRPIMYKVGQDVIFIRYHGERVGMDKKMFVLLKEDDILAVIEEDPEEREKYYRVMSDEDDAGALAKSKVSMD
jgi:co-chaperonin GroES (HSP10)